MHERVRVNLIERYLLSLQSFRWLKVALVLVFSFPKSEAQSLYFDYLGKTSLNEDMVSSFMGNINLNLDGGHTILASTSSDGEDAYVVRLDKNGKKKWSKSIGISGSDYGSGIAQTSDSGFLIVGTYASLTSVFLTKLNKDGVQQWSRSLSDASANANGWDVLVEPATGNIYVLGTTYGDPAAFGFYDASVTKFTSSGTQIWSKFYGSSGEELAYAMTFLKSGKIGITGSNNGQGFLIDIDTAGSIQWSRTLSQIESWDIQPTVDSGMIVSGRYTWSFIDEDFVIEKVDKNGNLIWFRRIGDASNSSTTQMGVSCYINPEGQIYMIGWGWSSPDGPNDSYGILVKLTSTGNVIWSKAIDPGNTTTVACKVAASGYNDGINIAGYTLAPNPSYWNIFDANLDSTGYCGCNITSFAMSVRSTTSTISAISYSSKNAYTAVTASPTVANVTTDTITVCNAPIILPIGLVSFTGEVTDNGNYISWKTASETDNDFFTLEKSEDANSFSELAEVNGSGTSTTEHSYEVIDAHPHAGLNYYQLKQTDFDGSFSYSQVIALNNFSSAVSAIIISPNPTFGSLQIEINDAVDAFVKIEIDDLAGHALKVWNQKINSGPTFGRASLVDLPSGIYLAKIFSGENAILFSQKVEKF